MMTTSIVEHDYDATASGSMLQLLRQETLEGFGIEHLADSAHELTGAQIDAAKAGDGLTGGSMQQNRILILRRHPHATARAVSLKVTFVQTPQFNVAAPGEAAKFFYLRN